MFINMIGQEWLSLSAEMSFLFSLYELIFFIWKIIVYEVREKITLKKK